ncbi:MAG: hypothetical protein WD342_04550 [Verrucomicrobiales bacterium]
MKITHFLLLLGSAVFVPCPGFADWREFTSADGAKTIEADIRSYDADANTVTLQMRDNRVLTTPVSTFSKADREHIREVGLAFVTGRNLWIEFEDVENKISEKRNPANGYQTLELEHHYRLEVRNNGAVPIEGLTVEYQVFYAAYEE